MEITLVGGPYDGQTFSPPEGAVSTAYFKLREWSGRYALDKHHDDRWTWEDAPDDEEVHDADAMVEAMRAALDAISGARETHVRVIKDGQSALQALHDLTGHLLEAGCPIPVLRSCFEDAVENFSGAPDDASVH